MATISDLVPLVIPTPEQSHAVKTITQYLLLDAVRFRPTTRVPLSSITMENKEYFEINILPYVQHRLGKKIRVSTDGTEVVVN